jgi:hypothetical protein
MFSVAGGATVAGLGVLSGNGACPKSDRTACPVMIDGPHVAGNVKISGITIVDSPFYNVRLSGVGNTVSNIKVISWLANTDGITPGSGTLSDSFFKTGDDAIKLYSSDLTVSGCTLWHLGNAAPFEMGVNLKEDVKNVTVENCDVIRTEWTYPNRSNALISAAFGGNAHGKTYAFRNIRVENTNPSGFSKDVDLVFQLFKLAVIPNSYTSVGNNSLGSISGVTFSNIKVTDPTTLPNLFQSFDTRHEVSGIAFYNVTVAGAELQQPAPTFNANRNLSFGLSGPALSNILWRSTAEPINFLVGMFTGAQDSAPSIVPAIIGAPTGDFSVQGVGDFNGNGYASVLLRNVTDGSLSLWDPPASAPPTFVTNVSPGLEVSGMGDFNGDGRSDILLWNATTQVGTILLMSGSQVFGTIPVAPGLAPVSDWPVVGIGDIDENGYSDIILRAQSGDVVILSFRPDGSYSGTPLPADAFNYCGNSTCSLSSWQVAGVGDIRGNGYASILWVDAATGQVAATSFAFEAPPQKPYSTLLGTMPSGYQIGSLGDFNGDGTMDILLFDPGSGEQKIWYTGYYGENLYYKQGPTVARLQGYLPQPYQVGPTLPPLGNVPARK